MKNEIEDNMMKKLLFSFLCLSFAFTAMAQIVLTNAHFPVVGDKLFLARDTFPLINITAPSANAQIWDFFEAEMDAFEVHPIRAASTGAVSDSFPNADIIIPYFNGDGYAKVYADSIEVQGFYGAPTAGLSSLNLFVRMDPYGTVYRSGFTYGSTAWDSTAFHLKIAAADIPPEADIPFQEQLDSIRIDFRMVKVDTSDAWGTLSTPFGTFDVIRIKEVQYRHTEAWVKHPFFGWVDLQTFNVDGLGPDTLVYYNFLNDQSKEPIFRVLTGMNDIGLYYAMGWYKVDAMTVATEDISVQPEFGMQTFPNPATDRLNVKLDGFPNGKYTLNVFNLVGRKEKEIPVNFTGDLEKQISLSDLNQGTYFCSLLDENGRILISKTFFLLRP